MGQRNYAEKFWRENEEYHDLVEQYYRGIETYHPDTVTSKRMCSCLDYCSYCGWAGTNVEYYRYNGPSV